MVYSPAPAMGAGSMPHGRFPDSPAFLKRDTVRGSLGMIRSNPLVLDEKRLKDLNMKAMFSAYIERKCKANIEENTVEVAVQRNLKKQLNLY